MVWKKTERGAEVKEKEDQKILQLVNYYYVF